MPVSRMDDGSVCSQLGLSALEVTCVGRTWAAEVGLGLCMATLL